MTTCPTLFNRVLLFTNSFTSRWSESGASSISLCGRRNSSEVDRLDLLEGHLSGPAADILAHFVMHPPSYWDGEKASW